MTAPIDRLAAALADRYAIEREIGAGGMATVYLAEDVKHHRKVAVKVLRPDLAAALGPERFLREITIAANLQHPHILMLIDSGEVGGFLYYVMPYVEGPSLRQKLTRDGELPIGDAVRILRDLADAMAYAHRHGVVHRDIKPENVMLSDRHALVTDFGVAKAVSEATGRQTLTTAGVALGTPTYMAPEQATADPHTDHRADIYAFGVVAYELLTGRPPFTGASPQAVLAAHVTSAAEPVTAHRASIPPTLAALVMKCLEKKPADRWQSADELIPQLEAVLTPSGGMTPTAAQPVSSRPGLGIRRRLAIGGGALIIGAIAAALLWPRGSRSVTFDTRSGDSTLAVLYFANLTRDSAEQYLADGLTEDVTNSLARVGRLAVKVPSAVHRAQSKNAGDLAAIGASLGVRYLLEGSLRRTGGGIRVAVRLVEHAKELAVWSSTYDRPQEALLALPGEIAREVAGRLTNGQGSQDLAAADPRRTKVPGSYEAFLRGNFYLGQRTREGNQRARAEFERAVVLDSSSVAARAGVAITLAQAVDYPEWLPPGATRENALKRAEALAEQALRLDSLSADAWFARAYALYLSKPPRLLGAREAAERAVRIDPRKIEAISRLTWIYGTSVPQDVTALEAGARQELALDPNFAVAYGQLAAVAYMRGQWREAVALADSARSSGWTGTTPVTFRAMARLESGDVTGAARDADWLATQPGPGHAFAYYLWAAAGNGARARDWLAKPAGRERTIHDVLAYAGLGERDKALASLDRLSKSAFDFVDLMFVQLPTFKSLRTNVRYQASLAEMGRRAMVR